MPYNPPHSMETLLGREQNEVLVLMYVIAVGWLVFVVLNGLCTRPTIRDTIAFVVFFFGIAMFAALIVICPPWPVTPLGRIFE
jgi:hypothetical protein